MKTIHIYQDKISVEGGITVNLNKPLQTYFELWDMLINNYNIHPREYKSIWHHKQIVP